jgi:hypothetical protein
MLALFLENTYFYFMLCVCEDLTSFGNKKKENLLRVKIK